MALTIGTQLGSHEIIALLGKGGMGEVYRARDLKLKREVAIKILPDEFSRDPDRVSRFQREAEVLASLNHPNIAAIYDLQEANDERFLVLELVEGETLADRIARGPIPVEEALNIAHQIAEALEAAHERGIIHRDLKPANVKVSTAGKIKVLDFGLAKAIENAPASSALSNSPTMLSGTMGGMILGTAAYMSPEQAKGRAADKRTDVWALGCVLYEMLVGKSAFQAEDVSDTLAAVLREEPDWTALPADVAPPLRILIQRCLAKDRAKRIADISVAKFLLGEPALTDASAAATPSVQTRSRLRTTLLIAAAVVFGAASALGLVWALRPSIAPAPIVRFSINVPDISPSITRSSIAISPDGTQLVYAANSRLYRRSISDLEARPITGTESKESLATPVFSPDGRWIAFFSTADRTIKKIEANGGPALTISPSLNGPFGMSWSPEGIVFGQFGQGAAGIFRVSPDGGTPDRLVSLDEDETASAPQILPGGRAVLFTLIKGVDEDRWEKAKIVVQSLTTGERKTLINGGDARYLPTGHLVYAVGGTVLAVPLDLRRQEVSGRAVPVLEGVRRSTASAGTGVAHWSVSNSGTLIYIPGPAAPSDKTRSLIIVDRKGSMTPLLSPAAPYRHPRVSRDGTHVAVAVDDGREAYISIYDPSSANPMRRLTFDGHNRFPIWSGDSQRIAFQSDREGDLAIFAQRADGASPQAERLTKPESGVSHVPESWSPDGRTLLFSIKKDAIFSLWTLSLDDKKIMPFGNVQSAEPIGATFSPDGRWVSYTVNDTPGGLPTPNRGVYVQPFPATGARYQVPKEAADFHPAWGSSGTELFYIPIASRLSVVSVQTHPNFMFGKAMTLPAPATRDRLSTDVRDYDVMPDGRFLSTVPAGNEGASGPNPAQQIRVVLDWFRELQERVPVK